MDIAVRVVTVAGEGAVRRIIVVASVGVVAGARVRGVIMIIVTNVG